MEPEETSIARRRLGKHVPTETKCDNAVARSPLLVNNPLLDYANIFPWKQHTTMNGVFCGSAPTLYNK
jgi:hypothetical protein